jgi:hypothetical protein
MWLKGTLCLYRSSSLQLSARSPYVLLTVLLLLCGRASLEVLEDVASNRLVTILAGFFWLLPLTITLVTDRGVALATVVQVELGLKSQLRRGR